jgi:hypothetical protein
MAVSTTTTAAELLFAEWVSAFIIPNLYAFTAAIPFSRHEDLNGKPSKVVSWPVAPALTSAALTEGTDATITTVTVNTQVQATLSEVGLSIELTDLLLESDILSSADWYSRQMLQAQEVKVNTDTTALFTGFSQIIGAVDVLTEADFLNAINKLEQANAPKPYVAVIKAKNIGDLRTDLATRSNTISSLFGHVSDIEGQTRAYGPVNAGQAFEHFNVPIFNDNTVTTTDAATANGNGMYSSEFALGFAHKWQNRVELQRRAIGRSTSVVLSTAKAEAELKDVAGVLLKGSV